MMIEYINVGVCVTCKKDIECVDTEHKMETHICSFDICERCGGKFHKLDCMAIMDDTPSGDDIWCDPCLEDIVKPMLDYCERCNSTLPEHKCEICGQTTCETCFKLDCIELAPSEEIKIKLWTLRESARAIRKHLIHYGFDIRYFEGYEQDDIIPRWYTSYAWILTKADINIELHMSSSSSNRAVFSIWIWKGVVPNLLVTQERLDFINWKKARVLTYLEDLEYMNLISHLNTIVEALT